MQNFAYRSASTEKVGPGAYESKKYIGAEGIKNSMSIKFEEFGLEHSKQLPGPGQYEVSNPKKVVMKKIPSYGIGTAPRPTSK